MSKKILVVGNDASSVYDFSEALTLGDFSVAVADDSADKTTPPAGVHAMAWNKSSAVSARSLIIQTETSIGAVDDYIMYFDSALYAGLFSSFTADNCQKACDAMITSFQYATMEALTRIQQRHEPSRLVFVVKTQPTIKDCLLLPASRAGISTPANAFVAAGEAAFANFAENIAAFAAEKDGVSVLLVIADPQNETAQKASAFASWLTSYIDALDSQTHKPSAKNAVSWVKAGAKAPGGFSLFH